MKFIARLLDSLTVFVLVICFLTELIGTSNCNISECLHIGFHHSSWWIFSFQDWLGWI